MIRSDVRITLLLVRATRMSYGPTHGRPNLLGIFPERTRRVIRRSGAPPGFAFSQLFFTQFYVKCPGHGVDLDDVAVLKQPDRAAYGGFGSDMADAEAASGAREPAVGNQRDLAAGALPGQRRGRRKHLPHSGTALRPLIADYDNLSFPVDTLLDSLESVFLAIKAAGRTGKPQV